MRARRRDPFGRLFEVDADKALARRRADWTDRRITLPAWDDFRLEFGVGSNQPNATGDVAKLQTLLHDTGYIDLDRSGGPTGLWGTPDDDALRRYQRDRDLKIDGVVLPKGQTIDDFRVLMAAAPESEDSVRQETANESQTAMMRKEYQPGGRFSRPGQVPFGPPIGGGFRPPRMRSLLPGPGAADGQRSPEEKETPKEKEVREAANEGVIDQILGSFVAEFGRRGTPETQKDINTTVRECKDYAQTRYPDLAERIEHIAGGSKDGEPDGEVLPEKYIPNPRYPRSDGPRKGSSYPDLSFYRNDKPKNDIRSYAHANTQDYTKTGRETLREGRNLERMKQNIGRDLAIGLAKRFKDETDEEFRKRARKACEELFKKWLGEPDAPDPDFEEGSDPNESP